MAQTISQLRQELEKQEKRLSQLEAKREQLNAELEDVDAQIGELLGQPRKAAAGRPAEKKAAKGAAKKGAKRGRKKGSRGGPSLNDVLAEVLQGKGQVRVAEAAQLAQKAGYQSRSKQFGNIVSQTLANDDRFHKVSRGIFELSE